MPQDEKGWERRAKVVARCVICLGFILAGLAHFFKPAVYARAVPPQFGHPLFLVELSGACEILGAIGILMPLLRRPAAFGLLALLVAVYPANIYMAMRPELFADLASPAALMLRLPLQFVFMWLVWWSCLR